MRPRNARPGKRRRNLDVLPRSKRVFWPRLVSRLKEPEPRRPKRLVNWLSRKPNWMSGEKLWVGRARLKAPTARAARYS